MNYSPQFPAPPPVKRGLGAPAIIGIVAALLFGGCVTCGVVGAVASKGDHSSTAGAAAPSPVRGAPPPTPVLDVSAAELFDAYHANEVAADARFKGKRLRVSGTVQSIDKGPLGGIVVRLASSNQFMPLDASLASGQESTAASMSKGTPVVIACTCGGLVIGRPQLRDCSL